MAFVFDNDIQGQCVGGEMTNKPFITVVTRACCRPKMLSIALNSVLMQTDTDVEVIFIIDKKKHGVSWANKQFGINTYRVQGQYVYCLDDDNMLVTHKMISQLKSFIGKQPEPPHVIMVKCRRPQLAPHILPKARVWKHRELIQVTTTNGGCFISRADVWRKFAIRYGNKGSGDWNYMNSIRNNDELTFAWLDLICQEKQQLGRGRNFEKCKKSWWEDIVSKYRLVEIAPGDWRLPLHSMSRNKIRDLRKKVKAR